MNGCAKVYASHIYPNLLYRLSVLPLPYPELLELVRNIFGFLYRVKLPVVFQEVCSPHPVKDGLGMLRVVIHQHKFRLNCVELMCWQEDGNGEFWKEDTCRSFPSAERAHADEENALPTSSSRILLLSGVLKRTAIPSTGEGSPLRYRALSPRGLHQMLVKGLLKMVWLTNLALQAFRSICSGASELK